MIFTWTIYATLYPHMIAASMSLDTTFNSLCVLLSYSFCGNAYSKLCVFCVQLSKLCEKRYILHNTINDVKRVPTAKQRDINGSHNTSPNVNLEISRSRLGSRLSRSATIHSLNPSIVSTISAKSDVIAFGDHVTMVIRDGYQKCVHEHEARHKITFQQNRFRASMKNSHFDHDNLKLNKKQHMIGFWCIDDEKESLIGRGAFSKVYKAIDCIFIHKDESKSIFAAIKIIDNSNKSEKKLNETQWMAKNEIECMDKVSHPNVIKMMAYDLEATFNQKDVIAFVLEYAPNGHLRQLVKNLEGLPENIAREYFHQIISAISACHAAGVVHRDLKLDNIVLDSHYNAKICDFGLAKAEYNYLSFS